MSGFFLHLHYTIFSRFCNTIFVSNTWIFVAKRIKICYHIYNRSSHRKDHTERKAGQAQKRKTERNVKKMSSFFKKTACVTGIILLGLFGLIGFYSTTLPDFYLVSKGSELSEIGRAHV